MERIETIHPDGKQGVNISKDKYELVKTSILKFLKSEGPLDFMKLGELVVSDISRRMEGSVMWYFTSVKLDLEAREEIWVDRSKRPQIISLSKAA